MTNRQHSRSEDGGWAFEDDEEAAESPFLLKVTQDGPVTVVGFHRVPCHDFGWISGCRAELYHLLDETGTKSIRLDISGMLVVPSEMLGLMVSVLKRGCAVEIVNATPEARDIFRVTNLDKILAVRE